MELVLSATRRIARMGTLVGGLLVVAAALLTVLEVFIRKATSHSLGGTSALTGYLLACSSAWAFGFALLERAHLRVDLFYFAAPRWMRTLFNLLALVTLTIFVGYLVMQAWIVFQDSWRYTSRDLTPMRIYLQYPQFIWFAGLAFLLWVCVVLLLAGLKAWFTGDVETLGRLAGPVSADDEVDLLRDDLAKEDR